MLKLNQGNTAVVEKVAGGAGGKYFLGWGGKSFWGRWGGKYFWGEVGVAWQNILWVCRKKKLGVAKFFDILQCCQNYLF